MKELFIRCTYCDRMSAAARERCGWCNRPLITRKQRIFNATVFWVSIIGILAAAYVAYQIGGWS